jgi:hypothetical protein
MSTGKRNKLAEPDFYAADRRIPAAQIKVDTAIPAKAIDLCNEGDIKLPIKEIRYPAAIEVKKK